VSTVGAELELDCVIGHHQTGEGGDWQPFDPLWRWLHQLALAKVSRGQSDCFLNLCISCEIEAVSQDRLFIDWTADTPVHRLIPGKQQ